MARKSTSFRVGRVRADLRGKVWYLTYHEGGQRHRPRVATREAELNHVLTRQERLGVARTVWRDAGAIKTDRVRTEFLQLTRRMGLPHLAAPKLLRHLFATCLQDANVDPLIRNELMGHSPVGQRNGAGLGMTANYTHTRAATRRQQLEAAMAPCPAAELAAEWMRGRVAS